MARARALANKYAAAIAWFRPRYMQLDPRTLGLYRIIVGLLLCGHCIHHWIFAQRYYSNEGILSNHWHLYVPSSEFNFSLFHSFSSLPEVHLAFTLSFVCFFLFTIGYKARLFAVLSFLWVTSLDNRLVMVENGGYVVVNLTIFWAMFLPTGRRFSVDAWRSSWRARREGSIEELNDREPRDVKAYISVASLICVANFAIIYIFNVVNKYGSTWRIGKTTQYVLHIDRMVTLPAVWLRELMPYPALQAASWVVLVVEAVIVMCILWPQNRLILRPAGLVLIFFLHLGFGVLMRLGPFSWFMIGYSSILLMACHWEWLGEDHKRRVDVQELRLPEGSGVAWLFARALKRLDPTERLSFVSTGGRELSSASALFAATRALPTGRFTTLAARVLSLGLLDIAVRAAFAFDDAVTRFFSLGAPPASQSREPHVASPVRRRGRRWLFMAHEGLVVYFAICFVSQVINENKSIPKVLKHVAPKFMRATIGYPRLFQGWGMFAPNPIRDDGVVAVDAVTIDGRHIDPFTGREPDLNLSDARGAGLDQIEQDYFNRIRLDRNKGFRSELERWIRRYHLETERPEDEVVFFNAYWLRDQSPEPGEAAPSQHEMLCIHSYKRIRYRPKPGLPRLPKRCKVVSADKDKLHEAEKKKREEERENRSLLERALTF